MQQAKNCAMNEKDADKRALFDLDLDLSTTRKTRLKYSAFCIAKYLKSSDVLRLFEYKSIGWRLEILISIGKSTYGSSSLQQERTRRMQISLIKSFYLTWHRQQRGHFADPSPLYSSRILT